MPTIGFPIAADDRQVPARKRDEPMAYSKCPACDRAIAKVRVVLVDPDPFMFTPEDLRPPGRLGFLCSHKGCGADLQRGGAPAIDQSPLASTPKTRFWR